MFGKRPGARRVITFNLPEAESTSPYLRTFIDAHTVALYEITVCSAALVLNSSAELHLKHWNYVMAIKTRRKYFCEMSGLSGLVDSSYSLTLSALKCIWLTRAMVFDAYKRENWTSIFLVSSTGAWSRKYAQHPRSWSKYNFVARTAYLELSDLYDKSLPVNAQIE